MDHIEDAAARARRGDEDGATAALRRAIDTGDPLAVGEAGVKLGIMHRQLGDLGKAAQAYRAAAAGGLPDKAILATYLLAGVLERTGRFTEAADAYQRVAGADHERTPSSQLALAELYRFDLDDPDAATNAYRAAIDSGDDDIAPRAMVGLADLTGSHSRAATELYERAAATGHPDVAHLARRALREHRREPEGEPGSCPAEGAAGCLLVLDGDGAVTGLWFEDPEVGDAYAADPAMVKGLLIANRLTSMLSAGYFAGRDHETGGFRISFQA